MHKIRMTRHSWKRWNERIGIYIAKTKLTSAIEHRIKIEMRKGLKPFRREGDIYYIFFLGKYAGKLVFTVVAPDTSGLWSGWRVITFLTGDMIGSIPQYLDNLYNDEGGEAVEM